MTRPVWYIDLPGLTLADLSRDQAALPAFSRMAREGWLRMLVPTACPSPAAAQATLVTGLLPAFHGVQNSGDTLNFRAPAWWERARAADRSISTLAALWEPSLDLDSPLSPTSGFPGNKQNGAHILSLLSQHPMAAAAFRMHGILMAKQADPAKQAAPSESHSATIRQRIQSMDRFVGDLLKLAETHHAALCISGETHTPAEHPAGQPALLMWGCSPVGDSGIPKDTLGSAELAWLLLNQALGTRFTDTNAQ